MSLSCYCLQVQHNYCTTSQPKISATHSGLYITIVTEMLVFIPIHTGKERREEETEEGGRGKSRNLAAIQYSAVTVFHHVHNDKWYTFSLTDSSNSGTEDSTTQKPYYALDVSCQWWLSERNKHRSRPAIDDVSIFCVCFFYKNTVSQKINIKKRKSCSLFSSAELNSVTSFSQLWRNTEIKTLIYPPRKKSMKLKNISRQCEVLYNTTDEISKNVKLSRWIYLESNDISVPSHNSSLKYKY